MIQTLNYSSSSAVEWRGRGVLSGAGKGRKQEEEERRRGGGPFRKGKREAHHREWELDSGNKLARF